MINYLFLSHDKKCKLLLNSLNDYTFGIKSITNLQNQTIVGFEKFDGKCEGRKIGRKFRRKKNMKENKK